jgi:DivIVA domain-containing protein
MSGFNMFQNKIALTPQDILEKEFKIDTRGYRLKEVDQFLDVIIGDYEQLFEIIHNLEQEKEDLLKEIMSLKQELRNLKMTVDIAKNSDKEITNIDIIRRLSQLEKIVYDKEDDNQDENLE